MTTMYSIPLGIGSVACTLVGRNIGKGKIKNAKLYAEQSVFIDFLISAIPCIFLFIMPIRVCKIFTNDENVIEATKYAIVLASIGFMIDTF